MRRALAAFAIAIALAPACKEKDNTKILVAVWSDLAVPTELDSVRIDVTGPSQTGTKSFLLTTSSEAGRTKLPVELELVPTGAKNATFTVKATGLRNLSELVSQTARVSFVSGQALLLKLFLGRDCQGKTCSPDYTCAAAACEQPVATTSLPPYEPGKPLSPPDAGPRIDGSIGLDSGALDSSGHDVLGPDLRGVDTGSVDVGVDAALDVPITGTGGGGGGGGTGGTVGYDGPRGTGGAPGVDANPIDTLGSDIIDAPLGGAGGASVDGGIGATGGTTGTGGAGGTGGGGGATGTGGATSETCVFGSSAFGSCKFGP